MLHLRSLKIIGDICSYRFEQRDVWVYSSAFTQVKCHSLHSVHRGFDMRLRVYRTWKIEGEKLRDAATADKKDVAQRSEKLISVRNIKVSLFQKLARSYYMSPQPVESPQKLSAVRGSRWILSFPKALVTCSCLHLSHMSTASRE